MTELIFVISDTQIPFDDRRALRTVIRCIGDLQPSRLIHIGDVLDFPQPSRWSKDTRAEFEGSIYADAEAAKKRLLGPVREVYSGPWEWHRGNHDERPDEYLRKYSPALAGTDAFKIETLCDLDSFGVTVLPDFHEIAPGWLSTHGHLGGIRLSQKAGETALNAARRFDKSVVMGHTHRLGLQPFSLGYGQKVKKTLWGFEVGNLMDMSMAGYLKGATGNWQQGFGILHVDGKHVKPHPVPILDKKFTVDGHTWVVG
ncbi:metallophosphoesterase [Nocardia grenadensis]|uniref:metallophosphoesterase n=1 Tax=Nocardia grenadensis TaxID=931537 RepID=UPI003D702CC6